MFSLRDKFTDNPSIYYSMSIAATWAGVGSLLIGMQMAQQYGIIPFLLWALGNTLACILFGQADAIRGAGQAFRHSPDAQGCDAI